MKYMMMAGLLSVALLGCGNDSTQSKQDTSATKQEQDKAPSTASSDKPVADSAEKIDDDTAKILATLESSEYDPNCKIPKTDYKTVFCFSSGEKTIFLAENTDDDYQITKRALIDVKGQEIADLTEYDHVDSIISHGLIAVGRGEQVGYINKKGELVIPLIYQHVNDVENKYDESWANPAGSYGIIVNKEGKYGIVSHTNEVVLPFNYGDLEAFDDHGVGLYFQYSETSNEYDGRELTEWGIIDYQGKQTKLSNKYIGAIGDFSGYDGFSEGLLGVYDGNNKYGFINQKGEVVIPLDYDEIRSFHEGLAGVLKDGQWGFIDKSNKAVIDFQYPDSTVPRYSVNYMGAGLFIFYDGIAEVSSEVQDETKCIDKSQNAVKCPYQ